MVRPGLDGGADWGGGAFDPETGILYIKVNDDPALVYPDLTDIERQRAARWGRTMRARSRLFLKHRIPVLKPPYAYLDALDLNQGTMLWQEPFGDNLAVRDHPALANRDAADAARRHRQWRTAGHGRRPAVRRQRRLCVSRHRQADRA